MPAAFQTPTVMAGLVPATHEHRRRSFSWIAGTSPAGDDDFGYAIRRVRE
jgi:hypothetical protein